MMKIQSAVVCGLMFTALCSTGFTAPASTAPQKTKSASGKAAPAKQQETWPTQDPTIRPMMYIRLLKMTPAQAKQVEALTVKHNASYAKIGKSKSDVTARLKEMRTLRTAYQKSLLGLLTPAQKEHFNKVSPMEVRIESLREQLGLSQQQADGLEKLMQEASTTIKKLQQAEAKGEITQEQRAKGFADAKVILDEGVKALLTPAQMQRMKQGFSKK